MLFNKLKSAAKIDAPKTKRGKKWNGRICDRNN